MFFKKPQAPEKEDVILEFRDSVTFYTTGNNLTLLADGTTYFVTPEQVDSVKIKMHHFRVYDAVLNVEAYQSFFTSGQTDALKDMLEADGLKYDYKTSAVPISHFPFVSLSNGI